MRSVLLLILISLWSGACLAAPSIDSSTPSSVTLGQPVTITGAGFGAIGPTVAYFDDFEDGVAGNLPAQGSSAIVGTRDIVSGTYGGYVNTFKNSGSLAFQVPFDQAGWSEIATALPAETRDIYVSYYFLLPESDYWPGEGGDSGTAINLKAMWILGNNAGAIDTANNDKVIPTILGDDGGTGMSAMVVGNDLTPNYSTYVDAVPTKGTWTRLSCWLKAGDPTGAMKFWKDAALVKNDTGVSTIADGEYRGFVGFPGYGRVDAAVTSRPTYDDVYIAVGAAAMARVELGDNSTYTDCTKLAVATVNTWADTSISASVRSGSFSPGETAYLFAIDADGVASGGYQVTIEGGPQPRGTVPHGDMR